MTAERSVLVVGAGRGGTSIAAALLDAHPEVEVAFEYGATEFLMDPTVGSPGVRRTAFFDVCTRAARASSACVWGNKITTEQVAALLPSDALAGDAAAPTVETALSELFLETFDGWPVVFVLRDGAACIRSKVRRAGLDASVAAERWIFSVHCYRFLMEHHPAAVTLRFEDLITSPERSLRAVCEFVGVGFDPVMLGATRSPKLLPEYRRDGFDLASIAPVALPPGIAAQIAPAEQLAARWSGSPVSDLERCAALGGRAQ